MSFLTDSLTDAVKVPEQGLASRILVNDDRLKLVVFAFAAGHDLKAHTAPVPVTIQILQGSARVTVADESRLLGAGALVYLNPDTQHAVHAETPMMMLLSTWKGGSA